MVRFCFWIYLLASLVVCAALVTLMWPFKFWLGAAAPEERP